MQQQKDSGKCRFLPNAFCSRDVRFFSSRKGEQGTTLVELLVVMVVLSLLAAVALPHAERAVQRRNEAALRETLREVRLAIDRFHDDWLRGSLLGSASANGYPQSLDILVEGVQADGDMPGFRRYLRALPRNHFAPAGDIEGQWRLLGYRQTADAEAWNGEDVYDLRAITVKEGLDGTPIAQW